MLDIDLGIWPNPNTDYYRMEFEWPAKTLVRISQITSDISELGQIPYILQIGPSCRENIFPEIEGLLKRSHPDTKILSIDVNKNVIRAIQERYGYQNSRVAAVVGNGWNFLEEMRAQNIIGQTQHPNFCYIVAANNLSRVAEYMHENQAYCYIQKFLKQVQEALHPIGETAIISRFESLRLSAQQNGGHCALLLRDEALTLAFGNGYKNLPTDYGNWTRWMSVFEQQGGVIHHNFTPTLRDVSDYVYSL